MPVCSVLKCSARKSKNQPKMTFHCCKIVKVRSLYYILDFQKYKFLQSAVNRLLWLLIMKCHRHVVSVLQENMPPLLDPAKNLIPCAEQDSHESKRVQKLEKNCKDQRTKLKRLHEKVRRQERKIKKLEDQLKMFIEETIK